VRGVERTSSKCSQTVIPFLPFSTAETTNEREWHFLVRTLKDDHGKHFLMTTLSSQERGSHEAVEEGTEEMDVVRIN